MKRDRRGPTAGPRFIIQAGRSPLVTDSRPVYRGSGRFPTKDAWNGAAPVAGDIKKNGGINYLPTMLTPGSPLSRLDEIFMTFPTTSANL